MAGDHPMTVMTIVDPADMVWADNTVHVADSVFPAIAYVPGELNLTQSLVFLVHSPQDNRPVAFVWSGVDSLELGETVREVQHFKRDRELLLWSERVLTYRPDGGCGCGHPLKNWNPWEGAVQVGVPRPRAGQAY